MASLSVNLLLVSFCSLLCIFSRGFGQTSVSKLYPCTGIKFDNVSRFKSDIYAVMPDYSNCSTNMSDEEDLKIGFRVLSWANISTTDYNSSQDPVVFIGRQGNSGVVSWNIPLQPQGFSSYFHHVNRTMCPSNITAQESDAFAMSQDEGNYLFYIDVFSSSLDVVEYSIAVETVPQFIMKLDRPITSTVGASSPQIHYFKFPDKVSTVTVEATTDSDRCAFVSVQNNTCPINDLLENACSRGIYQTMSKSAFLTVEVNQVKNREFVLIIITANYSICHGYQYAPLERIRNDTCNPNDTSTCNDADADSFVYAQDITVVIRELEPTSNFILAIMFPFLVFLFYLFLVCLYIFALPRVYLHLDPLRKFHFTWKFPWSRCSPSFLSGSVQTYSSLEESSVANSKDENGSATPSPPVEESLRSIHEPDETKLRIPLMYRRKFTKLNQQYTIYSW